MIGKFGRKTAIASAALAVGATGSALLAGTALADSQTQGGGGNGGTGGNTYVNCVLPIGGTLGILGQGGSNSQCNATGGGGGDAGTGVAY